mgnify:FL=1
MKQQYIKNRLEDDIVNDKISLQIRLRVSQ